MFLSFAIVIATPTSARHDVALREFGGSVIFVRFRHGSKAQVVAVGGDGNPGTNVSSRDDSSGQTRLVRVGGGFRCR